MAITRTTKTPAGTHLQGYVEAPYAKLHALFGEPSTDGYKVSSEWVLAFEGHVYTVYDYKDTNLYDSDAMSVDEFRALPSFNWHIGSSGDPRRFIEALKAAVAL